tara:strand:- start:114 stop:317 length:204 start_codon:yes stop_codon:yes gene_type:complete
MTSTKDGQYFCIRIEKEHINIREGRAPAFYLWAKDRDDLNRILKKKNITSNHIESIVEKGSDWDAIV